MKILANDGISDLGKSLIEAAGHEISTAKVAQEELAKTINEEGFDAVLVRSATTVRKEVIDACPGLKLIGRGGVGMDNIDVSYAREKGLTVINTPASSSQSVAELVMGQMLAISRFLNDSFKNIENGDFSTLKKNFAKGVELRGKTLGIIGFGRIGQSLAAYALGVGMKVVAIERKARIQPVTLKIAGQSIEVPVKVVANLADVIGQLDYISIHVPKQPDGAAVIGAAEFKLMKKGVRLVNTARGGVIEETALLEALDNGTVASAALDVYENEPTPIKALLAHPRIACTPHIGAATLEAQDRIGEELAELIIAFAKEQKA
ncbi:MAG: D-2-hydroxyacid dehydrogenase [Cryomorphaceae bacterium]|jgi:D-3-phosphoglycerate dehydrogenase|nr:D-2-hydroxyacid dehydrogenase [Cryomorphaceae bacterium]